jgi:hypothetical protein
MKMNRIFPIIILIALAMMGCNVYTGIYTTQEPTTDYGVRSVPTLMLFKKGEVLWRHSGLTTAEHLEGVLAKYG